MRRFVGVLCVGLLSSIVFSADSKTWMYKGCKLHVTNGARETGLIGSLLISVVAPSGKRATVRTDRDGQLSGAWAADLDSDGRFEVIVATRSAGSGLHGKVTIFTWTGQDLKKRVVPELNRRQLVGYKGKDQFSVSRNTLVRSFPLSNNRGVTSQKTLRLNLPKFRWEDV